MGEAAATAQDQVTGVILAGGRATRMGGVDKGLVPINDRPMIAWVIDALQPQVADLMINANRNIGAYESMGVAVWPDALPDYAGPLAGFLAGLSGPARDQLLQNMKTLAKDILADGAREREGFG